MKKATKLSVTMMLLAAVLLSMSGCVSENKLTDISKVLEVDVSKGTIVSEMDNHGGFHGDGQTYIEIRFADTECLNAIQSSAAWKPLPLTQNGMALLYGVEMDLGTIGPPPHDEEMGVGMVGPMLHGEDNKPLVPPVENGYYCFVDRASESTDPKDDTDVLRRYSYNFTMAIYDTDTNTLYYAELDT